MLSSFASRCGGPRPRRGPRHLRYQRPGVVVWRRKPPPPAAAAWGRGPSTSAERGALWVAAFRALVWMARSPIAHRAGPGSVRCSRSCAASCWRAGLGRQQMLAVRRPRWTSWLLVSGGRRLFALGNSGPPALPPLRRGNRHHTAWRAAGAAVAGAATEAQAMGLSPGKARKQAAVCPLSGPPPSMDLLPLLLRRRRQRLPLPPPLPPTAVAVAGHPLSSLRLLARRSVGTV